jgi:hypothetical protein
MTYPPQPGQYPDPTSGGFPAQSGGTPAAPQGAPAYQAAPYPEPAYPTGGYPAAGYPTAGYPQSGGFPAQPPSGGTAITAGVLAILGALWAIAMAGINFTAISEINDGSIPASVNWVIWMQAVVAIFEVLTLGPGAILLFMRKPVGRWLVIAGCALHITQGIVAAVGLLSSGVLSADNSSSDSSTYRASFAVGGIFGLIVVLIPAIATLILASVPLTGKWCAWGKQPANVQSYSVQPPYGTQPPQQW